ncbi:L-lactate dehydrogenase (quinone) large subunit LdhH [Desulfobacula sp.]|uniref:L-lactate dehydrogenase (quinone) large subunit LdhH n=1 Tax=Desulfobacula sp. TaxID=2593537 RepID=UPI0025BC88F9|nr:LUD domain-containing protein [Desulfobacula sp.]
MIKTARDMKSYKKQLHQALGDSFLRSALDKFNTVYRENRSNVYKDIDFNGIRDAIAQNKDSLIPCFEALFEEFKLNAEKAGTIIHRARDAQEANEIIAHIARENKVKKIIKSKSMTAEETFLNDHLEKQGFEVTETDLGEWIIQLKHEGPSHMVMPAIHLSRYQVGELFEKETRQRLDTENIDKLVKVARLQLRPKFLEADMGISGVNFAIADSGTLGLVTNEGNMRLVTTLPRVHVALVGFDKLVSDLKSALRILKLLPRNATGQAITSYVTWIKGANQCLNTESKKKIMHVVFLDNGRLALSKDPVFSTSLRCIRCGACANVCPIYSKVGGHKYGHVYIGAIGLILTLFYHGKDNDKAIVRNCINCQACKEVCPVDIDLPHLIKKTYARVIKEEGKTPVKNFLMSKVMKNRKVFHFILRKAYLAQQPLTRGKPMIRHLPSFLERDHGFRSLPAIAKTPLRDLWPVLSPKLEHPSLKIALFAGCAMDFIYPGHGKALLKLLQKANIQVDFPLDQTCCGLPAMMAAEENTAKELAVQNIKAFGAEQYDYILTLCASCASHLTHNYQKIFREAGGSSLDLNGFTNKIIDFSSFMEKVYPFSETRQNINTKVAYHAPCHLCRGLHVTDEPRALIQKAGYVYVPSKDEDVCCGFGGSYSVDFPEISSEILKKKLDNVEASGADILVTDCPGCIMQLSGGLDKRESPIKVLHLVELLAKFVP